MAQLVAAFASSHSVMLTCELRDWQRGFRQFDLNGSFYDRKGNPCTYSDLLAAAPANAAELVSDEAIERRFNEVHAAIYGLQDCLRRIQPDAQLARQEGLDVGVRRVQPLRRLVE